MRKIEQQMNRAIANKADWMVDSKYSNTSVEYNSNTNCSTVTLYNTEIATFAHNLRAVKLNSGGYTTNTTKSRLNAILSEVKYGCSVFQKNWNWYVSFRGQTQSFIDGMILIDANHLEVAI